MKKFTGWQWLLIDAANQYGHDKMRFEERIQWTESNLHSLENLADTADTKTKPLYIKAVMAIRKAQQGIATGHMVGVDGTCSGIQIMSALTGCIAGANATGLVDPDRRADAYTDTTKMMNLLLSEYGTADFDTALLYEQYYIDLCNSIESKSGLVVSRKDAKKALMTAFYGSKNTPKKIFGEDTPELEAFYEAANIVAPGAYSLLQVLLDSWNSYALSHDWKLPDGYDAHVKVMDQKEIRIEVDELDHASFTYVYYENIGQLKGLSNAANVVHSVDAYVLREMHTRCNYEKDAFEEASRIIEIEMIRRSMGGKPLEGLNNDPLDYYIEQYERSTLASSVAIPYVNETNVGYLTQAHIEALASIVNGVLVHKPFPLVTIHDEFKAHANNVNQVRWHYKEIIAEIADSNLLDDLLSQVYGFPGSFDKLSNNLGELIRGSNYALC